MESTKKLKARLRKYTIAEVLNHYDGEILGLDRQKRSVKYKKMSRNPFRFYRGSAYLFYFDISRFPLSYHTPEDKPTWIQGDLHFDNFGGFRNEQGEMVFDSNDFDEGYLGSYLYDVFRMAVSIGLYAEELDYSEADEAKFIVTFLKMYHQQLEIFAKQGEDPKTLLFTKNNTGGPVANALSSLEAREAAEKLKEMTAVKDGKRQFKTDGELEALTDTERQELEVAWPEYIRSLDENKETVNNYFKIKDAVRLEGKGTGSIGLNRYFILIEGEGEDHLDDIILEAKEARYPATGYYFSYDDLFSPDEVMHQGRRVIRTQKAMHYLQDPYLGFFSIGERHFYVRENSSFDEGVDPESLQSTESMLDTIEAMGKVTAKIHARADHDVDDALPYDSETEILKAIGDINRFAEDISHLALFYKRQVEQDYELFKEWLNEEFSSE
ncbi:DUF2252 domain-containing protein [Planococcus lenghuensis]|uniref:DUF2252 domain-containing protein n=1 Tax=Planococcus lenghuensis TaxID=2213202 RepID=A0A1Q2L239_9BACL|nr:DUF2252 family protein [Planococcus lenghuensis]AQQ54535.1 hypothetical protein B0X71_16455 [Planococcus lenghuensis]